MKKYIVTESQIRDILSIGAQNDIGWLERFMADLKPIEPLMDTLIFRSWVNANATTGSTVVNFARAIEAHITGGSQ